VSRPKDEKLVITLSAQSMDLLRQLAKRGIYGATPEAMVERLVDKALEGFVAKPVLVPTREMHDGKRDENRDH
jgi:hypothetical protein